MDPVQWIILIAGLCIASYIAGVGTGAWVWAIVVRLEGLIGMKADKTEVDRLRDKIEKK